MDLRGQRGRAAEESAARYLQQKGYRILARNVRTPCGEIDLICEQGAYIVFVEVKERTGTAHGHALEAVSPAQQRRITRAAGYWLTRLPGERLARIDLVALQWNGLGMEVTHVENAITS